MAVWLTVQKIIDITLTVENNVVLAVLGNGSKAHLAEQNVELFRLGMGEFNKFEAIRSGRICFVDFGFRRVVRIWSHFESSLSSLRRILRDGLREVLAMSHDLEEDLHEL